MSWERRRQEWKESQPEVEKIDEWFESLSSDERFDAFLESESFKYTVNELQQYLQQFYHRAEPFKFQHEPTVLLVSKLLGKIVLETPELRRTVQENQNVVKNLLNSETKVKIIRRIYALCVYETKKSGAVPAYVYNLSMPWQWEDTLTELGGY